MEKKLSFRSGWGGGVPILAAIFSQGLPIGRELTADVLELQEDVYAKTYEAVSNAGSTESVFPLVFWGALYLISFWFVAKQKNGIFLSICFKRQYPIFILLGFVLLGIFWNPNEGKILINFVHGLGVIFIALSAAIYFHDKPDLFVEQIGLCLTANVFINFMSIIFFPIITSGIDGRWSGLTGHPNTLGLISAFCLWLNGTQIIADKRTKIQWGRILSAAMCIVVLYGCYSVTSMITAGVSLVLFYVFSREGFKKRDVFNMVLIFILSVFFLWITVGLVGVDYLVEIFADGSGKSSDLSGRTEIWLAANDLIVERPIIGWGFDDNAQAILFSNIPHTHFHNGYLDLAVRGGVFGLSMFFLSNYFFVKQLMMSSSMRWFVIVMPIFIGVLVYNVSEVTFFAPRNFAWILYLFFIFVVPISAFKDRMNFDS